MFAAGIRVLCSCQASSQGKGLSLIKTIVSSMFCVQLIIAYLQILELEKNTQLAQKAW